MKKLQTAFNATLKNGKSFASGIKQFTLQEVLDLGPTTDVDGKVITTLEEMVKLYDYIIKNWHQHETITIMDQEVGAVSLRTEDVLYVTGHVKIVEVPED